jgi:two-component system, NtrC family, sensor kinase
MTIRFRLTLWIISIILIANSLFALITIMRVGDVLIDEVQTRVRLDLNSARRSYDNRLAEMKRILHILSIHQESEPLSPVNFHHILDKAFHNMEEPFDILTYIGKDGQVIYRAHNQASSGDDLSNNLLVAQVLQSKKPAAGTIILSQEELQRESDNLARRSFIQIKDTPAALPSNKATEKNGMMFAAAVPFTDTQNHQLIGILYGANLLNRRDEMVDAIQDEVFQNDLRQNKQTGMATIFMGDLRISTNVLNADGSRAIGTRLSAEVYHKVIEKGEIWAKRAFVVNDWYITAYEPIKDPADKIIGALYVGILEKPFQRTRNIIIIFFLAMVVITTTISLLLLGLTAKHILKPIGLIIQMSQKLIKGDLSARIKITPSGEMGQLCDVINQMADAVSDRENQLKQTTQRQIGQSEKLASIGRLAAGIAHEINNPLTGVLTFAHLLHQNDNLNEQDKEDVDVIIKETTRVREIIRGLLDFARESPSTRESLNLNEVIKQTLNLLRNQKEFRDIVTEQNLDDSLPRVNADKNQIQQVLLNLFLNACEAMPKGGNLSISSSYDNDSKSIMLTVADSGCGVSEDNIAKVFDPFFTTKPVGKGTGLGLSVSYGILQSHGGDIKVESELGEGTAFTLIFPEIGDKGQPLT